MHVTNFRDHRAWCPHGNPPTGQRLDLEPDHGAFPVWFWGPLRHRPEQDAHQSGLPLSLRISTGLAEELQAWADWQDRHQQGAWRSPEHPAPPSTREDWARWRAEGRALADRLAAETGAAVVYGGGGASCPGCGPAAA
jgi:hypothetical protein